MFKIIKLLITRLILSSKSFEYRLEAAVVFEMEVVVALAE
jgi:hypothetical protein